MSDLRERVAGILVDEFPEEIKRPSDAYRVADRILDVAGTEEPGLREVVGDIEHLIDMAETMSKRDLLSRLRHISTAGESALAARPVDKDEKK